MPEGAGRIIPQWIGLKGGGYQYRLNVTRGSLHNPTHVQMDLTVKASRLTEKVWGKKVKYSHIPAEQSRLKINQTYKNKNWPKKTVLSDEAR